MEVRNALASKLGLNLPSTLVFDFPNALSLAKHLAYLLDAIKTTTGRDGGADLWQTRHGSRLGYSHRQHRRCIQRSQQNADIKLEPLLTVLSELMQSVLGHPVRPSQPFMEAGLDSLGAPVCGLSVAVHAGLCICQTCDSVA